MNKPNFLIIGAPKAGTTSLYNYLKQHPKVYMSPVKEPHFFSYENEVINFKGPGDQQRLSGTVTNWDDYCKLFENVSDEIAIGEASTTYLSNAKAPQRIKDRIPNAKLIAILRNPVEAAYASFLHLIRDGDEKFLDFSQALNQEQERIKNNWDGLWHYKNRGFYYQQVKCYFNYFEPHQIKIYLYEDFETHPIKILKEIFLFLGVDETFTPDMQSKYNVSGMPSSPWLNQVIMKPNPIKSAFNTLVPKELRSYLVSQLKSWNFNQYKKPEMSSQVRLQLIDDYRQDILKLQDLTGQDFSRWLE